MSISEPYKSKKQVTKENIKQTLKLGKKVKTEFGNLYFYQKKDLLNFFYKILVKKKVGNAVKRNFCKRIARECIRLNKKNFKKFNSVIFIYTYQGKISFSIIKKELEKAINHL